MGIFKVRKVGKGFFWGLFFGPGIFLGLLVALGIYWDLTGAYSINFFPHHPVKRNPEYTPSPRMSK